MENPPVLPALIPAFLLLLSFGAAAPAGAGTASNKAKVLSFLKALPESRFERVLSGQFIGYGDDATFKTEIAPLFKKTKRRPFVAGVDYHDYKKGGPRTGKANGLLIEYWNKGGLVTISNHAGNPATGGKAKDRPPDWSADDMLKPGSKAHEGWEKELDSLAAGLKELKKAGVVVLWRPFHEMNGKWFWWGKQKPEVFAALWRRMHQRFQKEGLDNLLWVYSADPDPKTVMLYYPGDQYVDIVGIDVYRSDPENIPKEAYLQLTARGKPFAITEYGTGDPKASNHSGLSPLLKAIKEKFPKTVFFMVWYKDWAMHQEPDVKAALSDPWVSNMPEKTPPPVGSALKAGE